PGDRVARRRQAALHVRQSDVGDRRIERLHDRRQHDRYGDSAAMRRAGASSDRRACAGLGGAHFSAGARPNRDSIAAPSDRRWLVSTSTVALIPERSGGSSSRWEITARTGTRWTSLTQLPVAFCGGMIENSEPVPGLMPETVPLKLWLG